MLMRFPEERSRESRRPAFHAHPILVRFHFLAFFSSILPPSRSLQKKGWRSSCCKAVRAVPGGQLPAGSSARAGALWRRRTGRSGLGGGSRRARNSFAQCFQDSPPSFSGQMISHRKQQSETHTNTRRENIVNHSRLAILACLHTAATGELSLHRLPFIKKLPTSLLNGTF